MDLSIIITAHREGLIAHKTLKSVERACAKLDEAKINYEILISIDRGDRATIDYFDRYRKQSKFHIFNWEFGDLAESRNATIKQAKGRFVATIDADDLVSEKWLIKALEFLNSKPYGKYVAHSEMTISFCDKTGSVDMVQKYAHTNRDQDLLLSVWAARWNSVLVAPRNVFKQIKYPPNQNGYGYEDWHLSLSFINHNLKNVLIPKTVIFVRVKSQGSVWQDQKQSYSVLHSHPALKPLEFRKISLNKINYSTTSNSSHKALIRSLLENHPALTKIAKKVLHLAKNVKLIIQPSSNESWHIPEWLEYEWRQIHQIEKKLFPPEKIGKVYHTITQDHYRVGIAYWRICQLINQESYDYALFVPWLTAGGADLFAINYANYMTKLGQKVIVIATNETKQNSAWSKRLNQGVTFVHFGQSTMGLTQDQKYRLLEQLIENLQIKTIHILNSELAYDFVHDHKIYLHGTHKKIIATAYSQSTDNTGRIFGFSHTHLPAIYNQLDLITTDNEPKRQNWIEEYAFDPRKIVVHHQPFQADKFPTFTKSQPDFRILWASRLAPEKLPNLVSEISQFLDGKIKIDMYGRESKEFPKNNLQINSKIRYLGGFKDVIELPLDRYDLFLYTSLFDGMPNLPIEIALTGMPIVAAGVGGLPDFIGENGFLVEDQTNPKNYAKAIEQVYNDYGSALEKARKLRRKAKKQFSSKNFTSEIERVFKLLDFKL